MALPLCLPQCLLSFGHFHVCSVWLGPTEGIYPSPSSGSLRLAAGVGEGIDAVAVNTVDVDPPEDAAPAAAAMSASSEDSFVEALQQKGRKGWVVACWVTAAPRPAG